MPDLKPTGKTIPKPARTPPVKSTPKYRVEKSITKTLDDGAVVYRIVALKDLAIYDFARHKSFKVKTGDMGGWVAKSGNLSQKGKCWIFNEAVVRDKAVVSDDSMVMDLACVRGKAKIKGTSVVRDSAKVQDEATVKNSTIGDHAEVSGAAKVFSSQILNEAMVTYQAMIDCSTISQCALVYGNARVLKQSEVIGGVVGDNAIISDCSHVTGLSQIMGSAKVEKYVNLNGVSVMDHAVVRSHITLHGGMIKDYAKIRNAREIGNVDVFGSPFIGGHTDIKLECSVFLGTKNHFHDMFVEIKGGRYVLVEGISQKETIQRLSVQIKNKYDFFQTGPIGSRGDTCLFFRMSDGKVWVKTGCFFDVLENFLLRLERDYGLTQNKKRQGYFAEYLAATWTAVLRMKAVTQVRQSQKSCRILEKHVATLPK